MTQINSTERPRNMIRWWNRLAPLPLGPRLFSRAPGWIIPYSGTIVARVEDCARAMRAQFSTNGDAMLPQIESA